MEVEEWEGLIEIVSGFRLCNDEDMVQWDLEKNKNFSTKSLYRFISNPGTRDARMMDMWAVFQGQIQSAIQLVAN